jgi:hypothetical protein
MNATKLVVATVTAASVLGAIGLAYAQTTTPATTPSNTGVQQPMSPSTQGAPMDSTMPNNRGSMGTMDSPAAGTMSSPATRTMEGTGTTGMTGTRGTTPNPGGMMSSDGSGMQTERAARADRN